MVCRSGDSVRGACDAVSGIIRNGTIPAAMELIDKTVIRAVEAALKPGFPQDAEAVLIVELEDLQDGIEEEEQEVETRTTTTPQTFREERDNVG